MLVTGSNRWLALLNNTYDLTPVVVDNCFDDHQVRRCVEIQRIACVARGMRGAEHTVRCHKYILYLYLYLYSGRARRSGGC